MPIRGHSVFAARFSSVNDVARGPVCNSYSIVRLSTFRLGWPGRSATWVTGVGSGSVLPRGFGGLTGFRKTHQGNNLKIERTRASRKAAHSARRYHVSPVTRAIRNVLTVSAAALAFSGTGLVLAKTPVSPQALVAQHQSLTHAPFAFKTDVPVIDLTIVRDVRVPASVVDGEFDLRAVFGGQTDMIATLAASDGDVDTAFAMVADPTIVALVVTTDGSDAYEWNGATINATAYRAAGLFAHAQNGGDAMVHNDGILTADGTYAYRARPRGESGNATALNHNAITATGTLGATGLLAGGSGASYAQNTYDIVATSTGGFAAGVWAYGDTATASNWGDVDAYGNTIAVGIDAE